MLIFRKALLALTGLFICLFLTVHLGGNLILLLPEAEAHDLYNAYSAALSHNPFIQVIAYVNYACFILHAVYGVLITWRNRRARPVSYELNRQLDHSSWTSQNMGLLGAILFAFLVLHLAHFWYPVKFSERELDLYYMVTALMHQPLYASLYVLAMLPLGLHLSHGVASAFRSLGFYHRRYLVWIARIGTLYSVIVSLGFALIPLTLFIRSQL